MTIKRSLADGRFSCDQAAYPPFAVTVDIVLFTIENDSLKLLLIERGNEPYLGAWALPGGFVKIDEDLDQAAERELEEETGLCAGEWHLQQLGTYGAPGRDPRMRVVSVAFWAICASLPEPRGGGDASNARLFDASRILDGSQPLAFDHKQIAQDALLRTRAELENSALAAKFCTPAFTISELRRVYEIIWGIKLDPGNFHRFFRDSGVFERHEEEPRFVPAGLILESGQPVRLYAAPDQSAMPHSRKGPKPKLWKARNASEKPPRLSAPRMSVPKVRKKPLNKGVEDGG